MGNGVCDGVRFDISLSIPNIGNELLSEVEIRAIVKTIVDKAKRTAKVDQGV